MKDNYYDIIGVAPTASEKEILKGYRRKALTCHPDKNPDNPKAANLFIQLSEALEVLTDPAARAAFDNVLKARQAAQARTHAFDAKRKKFKDDLEQRERAAEVEKENDVDAAELLAERIKRLREEGSALLKKQQELMRKQLAEEREKLKEKGKEDEKEEEELITPKLKVRWTASRKDHQNGGYNEDILEKLFTRYGHVKTILLSHKRNGLAIVEFDSVVQANIALEFEKGLEENPLTIRWLDGPKKERQGNQDKEDKVETKEDDTPVSAEPLPTPAPSTFDDDFESLVLRRLRQAEERKRMTSQIIEADKPFTTSLVCDAYQDIA